MCAVLKDEFVGLPSRCLKSSGEADPKWILYKAVGKAMVERGTEHWRAQRRGTTAR